MGIMRLITGAALAAFLLIGLACDPGLSRIGGDGSGTVCRPPFLPGDTRHPSGLRSDNDAGRRAHRQKRRRSAACDGKPAAVVQPPIPNDAMVAADFPVPPDRDLPALARQLRWNGVEPDPQPARFADGLPEVGHTTNFWTLDYPRSRMVSKEFVLAAVSEHAYWWIEQGLNVDDADLQRSVSDIEAQIYPRVTAAFGAAPGSDADPQRGHIINGRIPGVGGYVSGADPYPSSVQPFSNGVPAIYINAREIPLGSPEYLTVLAHELQHAIHWYADPSGGDLAQRGAVRAGCHRSGVCAGQHAVLPAAAQRVAGQLAEGPGQRYRSELWSGGAVCPLPAGAVHTRGRVARSPGRAGQRHCRRGRFSGGARGRNRRRRTRRLPLRVRRLDGGQPAGRRWGSDSDTRAGTWRPTSPEPSAWAATGRKCRCPSTASTTSK